VLSERNFRLFFTGYMASLVGSAMVPVALTFAVLDQGDGTARCRLRTRSRHDSARSAAAARRRGRRPLSPQSIDLSMLGADIVRFISEAVLAVLLLVSSPPLWALMVLAGVLGAGLAFFSPAMTGLMPEIVSAARLQQANALRGIATSTGQIVGPSLAGIIVAAGGAGRAIAIDSATFAVSAACLLRLQIPARPDHGRSSLLSQLTAGWRASSVPARGCGSSSPSSPRSTPFASLRSWCSAPSSHATVSAAPGRGGRSSPCSAPGASSADSSPCASNPAGR
jgi:MFS family permease